MIGLAFIVTGISLFYILRWWLRDITIEIDTDDEDRSNL